MPWLIRPGLSIPVSFSLSGRPDAYGKTTSKTWAQQHSLHFWFLAASIQKHIASNTAIVATSLVLHAREKHLMGSSLSSQIIGRYLLVHFLHCPKFQPFLPAFHYYFLRRWITELPFMYNSAIWHDQKVTLTSHEDHRCQHSIRPGTRGPLPI